MISSRFLTIGFSILFTLFATSGFLSAVSSLLIDELEGSTFERVCHWILAISTFLMLLLIGLYLISYAIWG